MADYRQNLCHACKLGVCQWEDQMLTRWYNTSQPPLLAVAALRSVPIAVIDQRAMWNIAVVERLNMDKLADDTLSNAGLLISVISAAQRLFITR